MWQRGWSPDVRAAVTDHGGDFTRLMVLAAEVGCETNRARTTEVRPDADALRGHPVVAALRINACEGDFVTVPYLRDIALQTVTRLQTAGIDVVALALDFDAASSQLAAYTRWVQAIRAAVPVPVTITALPDWLGRPELPALLDQTDGWTLQVHDFDPPRSPDQIRPLLAENVTMAAIERAAALHRPFTVALPTYSYTAAFDPEGAFLGITAEQPVDWRPGVETREVGVDPAEVARIVSRLTADRPPEVAGLLWFRLPTGEDTHAWRWPTLAAVMNGRTPRSALHATATQAEPGMVELRVQNTGDADAPLPDLAVEADLAPMAADGYGGWRARAGQTDVSFRADSDRPLRVGEDRAVGWIRYPAKAEVSLHVSE